MDLKTLTLNGSAGQSDIFIRRGLLDEAANR